MLPIIGIRDLIFLFFLFSMTALTNEQVFAELYYSKKAIKDVLGVTVQCWR